MLNLAVFDSIYCTVFSQGSSIENAVRKNGDNEITWSSSGMLRLSPTIMRRLFRPTVNSIKQAIGNVLNNPRLPGAFVI